MSRNDERRSFLVSATVHVTLLTLLAVRTADKPAPENAQQSAAAATQVRERIFLPSKELLRQIAPQPALPPRPLPSPAAPAGKDRMSVGAPLQARQKGPLVLRREDDLTAVLKGVADGRPGASPAPNPGPAQPMRPVPAAGAPAAVAGEPGLRLRPGIGELAPGREGQPARPAAGALTSSLQALERKLEQGGALGLPSGTGQQVGPLFFDPQGADFTFWLNRFKNEVYRNWILPQAALLGFKGHVEIEFTVERDGRLSGLRVLRPAGTASFDRAAENALRGARLLALPRDYRPERVAMRVTFYYNEGPSE